MVKARIDPYKQHREDSFAIRLFKKFECPVRFTELGVHQSEMEGRDVSGFGRGPELFDYGASVALPARQRQDISEKCSHIRIPVRKLDSICKLFDGFSFASVMCQREAKVLMGRNKARIELERLPALSGRLVVLTSEEIEFA